MCVCCALCLCWVSSEFRSRLSVGQKLAAAGRGAESAAPSHRHDGSSQQSNRLERVLSQAASSFSGQFADEIACHHLSFFSASPGSTCTLRCGATNLSAQTLPPVTVPTTRTRLDMVSVMLDLTVDGYTFHAHSIATAIASLLIQGRAGSACRAVALRSGRPMGGMRARD